MASFNVHGVASIRLVADSARNPDGRPMYWQRLELFDGKGRAVGEVVLHLVRPEAAIPGGEEPPYWGVNPALPVPVGADGLPPF